MNPVICSMAPYDRPQNLPVLLLFHRSRSIHPALSRVDAVFELIHDGSCRLLRYPVKHHAERPDGAALTSVTILFTSHMIRSFADADTKRFFATGKARKLPRDLLRRAAMRLQQLDAARTIADLRLPPSNRLEALKGNRAGQHAIRINDQWR